MRALVCAASVLIVMLVAGLVTGPAGAQSDEKVPSIKKVMSKLHKGKTAPVNAVKAALKSDSPDWAVVLKDAKEIAKFGAYLPKSDPPKGSKESWEKLAKAYAANGKALVTAAEKEELPVARGASTKLSGSCKACHSEHKED